MAALLLALHTHGLMLVHNRTATMAELTEWLAGPAGLTRGRVLLGLANSRPDRRASPAAMPHCDQLTGCPEPIGWLNGSAEPHN